MTQRGRAGARPDGRTDAGRRGGRSGDRAAARGPAAPRVDVAAARARVRAVVEPVVTAAGYDLEDLTLSRAGRRHVLRVLVDTDGGVGLDDVALVSRDISAALDAAEAGGDEVIAGEYQLEVGSPGVDRPLTLPRHWRRNVGRLVAVTAAGRSVTGRVAAVDDAGVVLDCDGTPHEYAFADLGPGRVQVEFRRLDEAQFADDDEDAADGDEDDADDDGDDAGVGQ